MVTQNAHHAIHVKYTRYMGKTLQEKKDPDFTELAFSKI